MLMLVTQQHGDGILGHTCPRANLFFFNLALDGYKTSPLRVPGREEPRTVRGNVMANDWF